MTSVWRTARGTKADVGAIELGMRERVWQILPQETLGLSSSPAAGSRVALVGNHDLCHVVEVRVEFQPIETTASGRE